MEEQQRLDNEESEEELFQGRFAYFEGIRQGDYFWLDESEREAEVWSDCRYMYHMLVFLILIVAFNLVIFDILKKLRNDRLYWDCSF